MNKFNRFKDAPWFPKEDVHTVVGGAGGIGSWLTLLLSRAGFKPIVFDFDTLEEHNLGGQFFSKRQIGKTKVEALEENVQICNKGRLYSVQYTPRYMIVYICNKGPLYSVQYTSRYMIVYICKED